MKQMLTDRLLINMMSAIYHATDVTLFADEAEQIPAYDAQRRVVPDFVRRFTGK